MIRKMTKMALSAFVAFDLLWSLVCKLPDLL